MAILAALWMLSQGCAEQELRQQLVFVGDQAASLRADAANDYEKVAKDLRKIYLEASDSKLQAALKMRILALTDTDGRVGWEEAVAAFGEHQSAIGARQVQMAQADLGLRKAREKRARAARLDALTRVFLEHPDVSLDDASDMLEAFGEEIP